MTGTSPTHQAKVPLYLAIIITLVMVIVIREGAVVVCRALNIESAANIVGMIVMFTLLMTWRLTKGLPEWLSRASNTLLVDSGFAFLPVSAGAGLLLFALGDEFWGIVITMVVSTLVPLWGLAKLANHWLNPPPSSSGTNTPTDDGTAQANTIHPASTDATSR